MARLTAPLPIIRGEPFEVVFILRASGTEDPLTPWPSAISASVTREGTTVDFTSTEDEGDGTILFELEEEDTTDMSPGLWKGGLQVDGRTWLRMDAVVQDDPTP